MPDQLQLRGGTTAEHSTFTGASKEVTVDTTKKTAVVHDGTTAGGIPLLRQDGSNSALALGSQGTPSLKWDANTGIYSPGEDQLAVATNGTPRLSIDASGNVSIDGTTFNVDAVNNRVGIGATPTGAKLSSTTSDVGGTIGDTTQLAVVNANGAVGDFAGIRFNYFNDGNGGGKFAYIGSVLTSQASNGSADIVFGTRPTSTTTISEVARIRSDGMFEVKGAGVAGSSPAFSVSGSAPANSAIIDTSGRLLVGTSTARSNFFNTASSAPQQLQVEGTTGNTCSLSSICSVADTSGGRLLLAHQRSGAVGPAENTILNSGDETGVITFQGNDGGQFVESASISAQVDGTPGADDMPGRLVFSTTADGAASPTERMRINNLGAFKATTTNSYAFSTNKMHELRSDNNDRSVWITNTNASPYGIYIKFEGYDPNGTGNEFLVCDANATTRATIRSNGGLANYSANNANLSDRNVKKDITLAAGTWDCIKEWEIVNYRYKDQPDDADLSLGVIAQQVAESCPEVITIFQEAKEATEDKPAQEERLGVKEQQMYWMAIKALQEAMKRIETLETEVAALKTA